MSDDHDPVAAAADTSRDIHGIATWAPRSTVDRAVTLLYALLRVVARIVVVALSLSILATIGGVAAVADPRTAALALLSAIPAAGLAAYVWYTDVTTEPVHLLLGTFLLYGISFDGLWGLVLFGKLERYRAAYDAVGADGAAVRSAFQFGSR